ncbi:unnamed protein product [Acanthoscelides obtectus]|uniref:Uncharacterized protein n=1 Tax=Acanthoscelides obtectus TaxID=200917 RepID=A0A9P0PLS1_ACAOB|nr:unnamed protein product [Acanthoscelides obtectus]CAK1621590.1 hypothetical protein AOBTE_LOCUS1034 [Acanthoscelides obtectus]
MFKVLGRLAYSVLLIHFGFQTAMLAAGKNPTYFSNFMCIFNALSDIAITTAVAIPFTLFFEYPAIGLVTTLLQNKAGMTQKTNRIDVKP